MSGLKTKLGRGLGLVLLAGAALGAASCNEEDGGGDGGTGGVFGNILEQCGLECPEPGKGVAFGNASVTGYGPIDSFFRSVINYRTVALGASAQIDLELQGIKELFGITEAELKAKANLGEAIKAKIQAQADIVVKTTPADCSVDAKVAAEVSAKCQAQANCQIDPGMASFECMGTCTVEANVEGSCQAGAEVRCQVTAPEFACMGTCEGTCEVTGPVADCNAACSGTCSGTCSLEVPTATCSGKCTGECGGTCEGGTKDASGRCSGTCMGQCSAGCEVTGQAAASCQGTCRGMCTAGCEVSAPKVACNGQCNGTCEYNPGSAKCDARAEVKCDIKGSAAAMCSGSCDGNFTPPSAKCDASASCQASAKAEARFQVKCTPPRVDVKVVAKASATLTQTEIDFLIAELTARLPRISAAVARADVVVTAGTELGREGRSAVEGTVSQITSGKVGLFVSAKVAACTGDGLQESTQVLAEAKGTLDASIGNARSVANTLNMLM